jgi:tetratricopeptide (TPR) repeat protein
MSLENRVTLLGGTFMIRLLCLSMLLSQVGALAGFQSPALQLNDAQKLALDGKLAEAEASVHAFISRRPIPDAFDLLGYIYEQRSSLDQAEEAYRQAIKLEPTRKSSKVRLGIIYGKEGRYAECIVVLEKLTPDIRENPEALFYLCRSYLETRDTDRALSIAAMVERLGKVDPGALLSVGRLLVSKELNKQAVPILRKAVDGLGNSAEAHYCLALALFKIREYDEMSENLQHAEDLDPTAPRILLLRALSLLDTNKVSAAKAYIRKARALSPGDKFTAYLWGRILIDEKNYGEAIKLLSDLIASGFNDPNAHLLLITAYRKNGEFEKAVNYALKLVQMFPGNASAHLRAGVELEFLGDYQQAEGYLRKAIALGADDSEVLTTAKFSLGKIFAKQGNNAEAVQLLKEVIASNRTDVYARVELGDMYRNMGQQEEASKVLQEAISFDPLNKRAHFLLGNVLNKLGKPVEAEQHFKIFQDLEKSADETKGEKPAIYTQGVK